MNGIQYDKETIQFEAEKVIAEIERLQKYLNKFKKTFLLPFYENNENAKNNQTGENCPVNTLINTNTNTIYKIHDGSNLHQNEQTAKIAKISKIENHTEYEEIIKNLYKRYFGHLSEFEISRQSSKEDMHHALQTYDKLIRAGYTKQLIEQAVQDATNDAFWRQQFRSFRKLTRKNKDGVQYIDVFLALKSKQHKLSVPKIIR